MMYSHARYAPTVAATADNTTDCVPGSGGYFFCGATEGAAPLGVQHGVYGAINTVTGKVAWTIPIISSAPASGMAVGGDLVFFGDSDGLFYAANAATGEILWVYDALTVTNGGGANAGPAVYEVDGVEYVVNAFGGDSLFTQFTGDAVIAFALPSAVAAAKEKTAATDKALAQRGRVR